MGCDIHCYIEYRNKSGGGDPCRWDGFGGRINPGRNYPLFSLLAGVRSDEGDKPLIEPRGMPEDAAYESRNDNQLYISETPSDEYVTAEKAAYYVAECGCRYVNSGDGKPAWVTHPDWHTHSWCSSAELEAALSDKRNCWGGDQEYNAVLAAMRSFESAGFEARLVFWFDN